MAERKAPKRRVKKNIPAGICHIQATFNNTIVTMTDLAGNVVSWSSAGVLRFKGSRKSTPFAAQLVAEDAANKAREVMARMPIARAGHLDRFIESAIREGELARNNRHRLRFPVVLQLGTLPVLVDLFPAKGAEVTQVRIQHVFRDRIVDRLVAIVQ